MILSLASHQNVKSIDLGTSTPKLSGIVDVSGFDNLISLSAIDNDIENFKFHSDNILEEVSLNYNMLQGSVNQYIPLSAKKFSIDSNLVTSILSSLSAHPNLEDFRCSDNRNTITGRIPDISLNPNLTIFKMYNNGLSGVIPDITSNTNLRDFQINKNNLIGNLPTDLSNNTALEIFKYGGNAIVSGRIPDLSDNPELTIYEGFFTNTFGSIPSLSANTKLKAFNIANGELTGRIPDLSANIALENFIVGENDLIGNIPDLSNNLSLKRFEVKNNRLSGFSGNTVSSTLKYFLANNNILSNPAINNILAAFVSAGSNDGALFIQGNRNGTPTGPGIANIDTLSSRGWNLKFNEINRAIGYYFINVDFNLTNIPITSFDPDGNINDRPRINTFREDGEFITYLSAGGVYEDDVTGNLSITPWGNRSIASTSATISALSGTAGVDPGALSAGVDIFTSPNLEISLSPDVSNWTVSATNPGEVRYQLLFNTAGTKDVSVTILPKDEEVWDFTNPGTNSIAWILSSQEPLSGTFNWADGSARETFDNNIVAQHTFTGNASFSGVRYSNASKIHKFASRLGGGSFPTNTYAASGTIDLSKMPNLLEYTIEDHGAVFTNFNSVNTNLIRFQHWNNQNTGLSYNDLDLSRLTNLQVFSIRGTSTSVRGNFTGQLHSIIPSTLNVYNGKYNSLTGNLPIITSNFSNIKDYDITQNAGIVGELKNLANLGSNRSTKDVQFLSNRTQFDTVASDFTINTNFLRINLLGNNFTTAELNKIVQKCDASGVTNCNLDLRAQTTSQTVTDAGSVSNLQGKGWTVQF